MEKKNGSDIGIVSGYQFSPISALALQRERAESFAAGRGLKGTVLLAGEGINFSLCGPRPVLDEWLDWIGNRLGCTSPVINRQSVDTAPFLRLKVHIREEIVTFDRAVVPASARAGESLDPVQWNALLTHGNVQLVDARNDYEYRIGSFTGAVNPHIDSFTEFKAYCRERLDPEKPVAMFCTGGVRCEKATAWLKTLGYGQVYQLHGGILGYLAAIPAENSQWHGECFVFDDRVSLDASLRPTGRVVCRGCRHPAEGLDAASVPPISADGECRLCGQVFDESRLGSLRERARQVALARERGVVHLGPEAQSHKGHS